MATQLISVCGCSHAFQGVRVSGDQWRHQQGTVRCSVAAECPGDENARSQNEHISQSGGVDIAPRVLIAVLQDQRDHQLERPRYYVKDGQVFQCEDENGDAEAHQLILICKLM